MNAPLLFYPDNKTYRITYPEGIVFEISDQGLQIAVHMPPRSNIHDMATYLQGPVLGFVLRLQGITCLHASVVTVDGYAFAFVGQSGLGKSTLASSLSQRGARVLSDDILALESIGGKIVALPGYPRLRLWPESAEFLLGDKEALPKMAPRWDKRYLDLMEPECRFESNPKPLAAIFLLNPKSECGAPAFRRTNDVNGFLNLLGNVYPSAHLYPPDRQSQADVFRAVRNVYELITVVELDYLHGFDQLPRLRDSLMAHIADNYQN